MICTMKTVFLVTYLVHVVISLSDLTDQPETPCKNLETAKEIESLKQQLNQGIIIRLSVVKQVHSLVNDVISLKKELTSNVQQIERNINDLKAIDEKLPNTTTRRMQEDRDYLAVKQKISDIQKDLQICRQNSPLLKVSKFPFQCTCSSG